MNGLIWGEIQISHNTQSFWHAASNYCKHMFKMPILELNKRKLEKN